MKADDSAARVAITGTPGTGKSSVAKRIGGYEVIHLTEFVKNYDLGYSSDIFEVNIPEMTEKLDELLDEKEKYIIEGHLSHHYPAAICVVLRCDPEELEERLENRSYPREKINENVESEAMDLILQEALQKQDTVVEVDTTENTVEETVEKVKEKIEKGKDDYGDVDWTDRL